MTDDFSTRATLDIEVSQRSLRQARQQIESEIGTTEVGVTDGGTASAQAAGGRGSRARRRERRTFRLDIERNDLLEDIHETLEGLDPEASGGSPGLLGGIGAGAGRGLTGLGIGAGAGLAGLGIGAGVGLATGDLPEGIGAGIGAAIGDSLEGLGEGGGALFEGLGEGLSSILHGDDSDDISVVRMDVERLQMESSPIHATIESFEMMQGVVLAGGGGAVAGGGGSGMDPNAGAFLNIPQTTGSGQQEPVDIPMADEWDEDVGVDHGQGTVTGQDLMDPDEMEGPNFGFGIPDQDTVGGVVGSTAEGALAGSVGGMPFQAPHAGGLIGGTAGFIQGVDDIFAGEHEDSPAGFSFGTTGTTGATGGGGGAGAGGLTIDQSIDQRAEATANFDIVIEAAFDDLRSTIINDLNDQIMARIAELREEFEDEVSRIEDDLTSARTRGGFRGGRL